MRGCYSADSSAGKRENCDAVQAPAGRLWSKLKEFPESLRDKRTSLEFKNSGARDSAV